MSLKLTPLGEFVAKHSTVTPKDMWLQIVRHCVECTDREDQGVAADGEWSLFLQELASGCQELVENDKFLELLSQMEESGDQLYEGP